MLHTSTTCQILTRVISRNTFKTTNPKSASMSKSFIQISDSHIDDHDLVMGVDSHANLNSIVIDILKQSYNALLVSGDLSHNGTLGSYQKLKKIIKPLGNNIYVLPGNHDDKANLYEIFNKNYLTSFQIADWEIITIDSVQIGKTSGFLNKEELNSLTQKILSSASKYIVICLHHPIVSMQSNWDDKLSLENPDDFFKVVDQFKTIKAVIWGHAHQSSQFNRNGIELFSCPSTAVQFNGSENIGYNHYTLKDSGRISCNTIWL